MEAGDLSREDAGMLPSLTPEKRGELQVLVVDDEHTIRETCATILERDGYRVTTCGKGGDAEQLLRRRGFDILLLDLNMSQVPGMRLLEIALETHPGSVVIMITGKPSLQTSVMALRRGAFDYLPKPFSASHLKLLVDRAALTALVAREAQENGNALRKKHGNGEGVLLLGSSPAFRKVIALARKVAPTEASVFITGESGTGKELIARFIHENSRRRSRPFVPVNCAALPEALLESELFGHVKGAFTGAVRDKPGLLETANGGTFFLDELTEMSAAVQAKLLRVIQDGQIRRVGSAAPTDSVTAVRFIAATNRDPVGAVEEGVLRRDLYYRLRVVPVVMPPLRERVEDIEALARHFVQLFWLRDGPPGSPPPRLSAEAVRALQASPWPGNVRELQNVIEHALVLSSPGEELQPEDLPFFEETQPGGPGSVASGDLILEENYHAARERLVSNFERTYLIWLVNRAEGNISEASRIAGVDRTTLYRLMDKHSLSLTRQVPVAEG